MSITRVPNNPYGGRCVTVTTTPQSLWALLLAVDPNIGQAYASLTLNYSNSANAASTGTILIGDGTLTSTNFGYELTKGSAKVYPPTPVQGALLGYMFVMTTTGTALLSVEYMNL